MSCKIVQRVRIQFLEKFYLFFVYLFLTALGLRCCAWAFSSCGERGLLFIAVHGLLIVVASLVVEHRLQVSGLQQFGTWAQQLWLAALEHMLSSCGAGAQLLRGMWDLPGPGIEPVTPALGGGFLNTAPPGKPESSHILFTLPPLMLNLFFVINFYWSIVALQYCVSFYCTAK